MSDNFIITADIIANCISGSAVTACTTARQLLYQLLARGDNAVGDPLEVLLQRDVSVVKQCCQVFSAETFEYLADEPTSTRARISSLRITRQSKLPASPSPDSSIRPSA